MAGREKNCSWYFADQPQGYDEQGPQNALEQTFKHYPYASLVRESIQNSLDAVLDTQKPVLVKFSFITIQGVDFPMFFELGKHIKGCLSLYNDKKAQSIFQPMLKYFGDTKYSSEIGLIRVSDFNTKGMDYREGDSYSSFTAFVRSTGVSSKANDSAGGSFGFGKAAYFLISPIKTIIVSTCNQYGKKCFEGVSRLCTHMYNGVKKVDCGFYDNGNGTPITDEDEIPSVFRRNEPGTDINIMGFDIKFKDEAYDEIIKAVLRNFWMAVWNEKLVVEIDNVVRISKDNITEIMEFHFPEDNDSSKKSNNYNPRPYFDAVRLARESSKYVLYEDELSLLGKVNLYVNKQKNAPDKISYMRALQMLVYAKPNKSSYGMYGVFYCGDKKGNELLRELENSSHNEWKAANWQDGNRRVNQTGKAVLRELEEFINEALKKTFSLKEKTILNIKGLEEFLYIPTEYDEDEDLESESFIGEPTGQLKEDGVSVTTDIKSTAENPFINRNNDSISTGQVLISKQTNANNENGQLFSGHTEKKRMSKTPGVQMPGDAKDKRKENENGFKGVFASPIIIPYRTFCQVENGIVYHYLVLHSDREIANVRLHFYAVGEESDEELRVLETSHGKVNGYMINDLHLNEGRMRIKIRFTDKMKHTVKLLAEEMYEI